MPPWFRFLPVMAVMGIIFFLSHQPGGSFDLPEVVNIDKLLHCLAYAVLGLAAFFALPPRYLASRPLSAGCGVILFCLLFGIADELHQYFIPGRSADGWDLVADTGGGVVAVFLGWRLLPWIASRRPGLVPRQ